MIENAIDAANESIESGLYIIWVPTPSCILGPTAADEIRNGTGQCSRVGQHSTCICGHLLQSHKQVVPSKSGGYNKPPTCLNCKKCKGFNYSPSYPEEVGQIWLKSRNQFDINLWRQRVREKPHEYACIGCEQAVSNHETIFETRNARTRRGAKVDNAYIPERTLPAASSTLASTTLASAAATERPTNTGSLVSIGAGRAGVYSDEVINPSLAPKKSNTSK